MTGSAYGTTPSALASLVKTVAEVRKSYRDSGTLAAVMILLRRRQRRGLIELVKSARFELHNDPNLIAEVIAGGAAGAEAAAWADTADAATKAFLRSEEFLKSRQEKITAQLDDLGALLTNAARGNIEPQAILDGVGRLLDLFLPPAAGETAGERAAAAARVARQAQALVADAKTAVRMGTDRQETARAVVDKLAGGVAAAFEPAKAAAPAKAEAAATAAAPAKAETAATAAAPASGKAPAPPVSPPKPSAHPRFVVTPTSVAPTAAVSPPLLKPLTDRFLERRCALAVGHESPLFRTNMLLAALARQLGDGNYGALHITCTDEAEADSRDRFLRGGVGLMLPALAGGRRSGLMICNRGGCCEPGALAIAVDHYAAAGPLTMVVRVQSHCGVTVEGKSRRFGEFNRYGKPSPACGALKALLENEAGVARAGEIARTLDSRQLEVVRGADPAWRLLLLAVLHSRTQLEAATAEIRALGRPARYVLFGSVNLNGISEPAELPIIIRLLDRSAPDERSWELALPADAARLTVTDTPNGLVLQDVINDG